MDLVFGAPDPKPSLFGGPFWKLTIKLLIITKPSLKQQVYNEKNNLTLTDQLKTVFKGYNGLILLNNKEEKATDKKKIQRISTWRPPFFMFIKPASQLSPHISNLFEVSRYNCFTDSKIQNINVFNGCSAYCWLDIIPQKKVQRGQIGCCRSCKLCSLFWTFCEMATFTN